MSEAIADINRAQVCTPDKVDVDVLSDRDHIGIGSGIYYWKHRQSLLDFVDTSHRSTNVRSSSPPEAARLTITTTCSSNYWKERPRIVAEFSFKGLDTSGFSTTSAG